MLQLQKGPFKKTKMYLLQIEGRNPSHLRQTEFHQQTNNITIE